MDTAYEGGSARGASPVVSGSTPVSTESTSETVATVTGTEQGEITTQAVSEAEVSIQSNEGVDELVMEDVKQNGIENTLTDLGNGKYSQPYEMNDTDMAIEFQDDQEHIDFQTAELEVEKTADIPDEVRENPAFKQKLGEVVMEKILNNEPINPDEVSQEALQRYEAELEKDELTLEQKVEKLETEVKDLTEKNEELEERLLKAEERFVKMGEVMTKLMELMLEEEEKKKKKSKKISLLELLILAVGALMQEFAKPEESPKQNKPQPAAGNN